MQAARTLFLLSIALLAATAANAAGWRFNLADHPLIPPHFLAIDKDSQKFMVMGRQSPLATLRELSCATGQEPGDKLREGDLKTPEGVYFVEHRLTCALDYEMYGDMAFALNFPNPVDKIKGKTGYGIWIHGRGRPIEPRETKGCIALNTPDLHTLESDIAAGTPVVIAESISPARESGEAVQEAEALRELVQDWADAWANKSEDFFAFYDPERFSISQGSSFAGFKRHKESIFARQPWIQVMVSDIHVLSGPDYWVTWFNQYYRTKSLVSGLTKRLYWQKDAGGRMVIVGKEQDEPSRDLDALYLEEAGRQTTPIIEAWREAWEAADLDTYGRFYDPEANQQGRRGIGNILAHKRTVWADAKPDKVELSGMKLSLHPMGVQVSFTQKYAANDGYRDLGTKTLVLEPHAGSWRIVDEEWAEEEL